MENEKNTEINSATKTTKTYEELAKEYKYSATEMYESILKKYEYCFLNGLQEFEYPVFSQWDKMI
jgi:hypothetical protein